MLRPLFGNFELTLDEKNRLLVPSDIRKAWNPEDGDTLVILPGVNEKLWVYTEKFYEEMSQRLESKMEPEDDKVHFDLANFALANRIEVDKAGRILIPDRMVKENRLDREVMVLGARDHFEIWNRSDWYAWKEEIQKRRKERQKMHGQGRVHSGSATVGGSTQDQGN
jgi:MraZ protein